MWEAFNDNARRAAYYAREEANRRGDDVVAPEDFLLGIIRDRHTAARDILLALDVLPVDVRRRILMPTKRRAKSPKEMRLSPEAKVMLGLAYDEARRGGVEIVGTRELLLAIVASPETRAGRALASMGVTLDRARRFEPPTPERQSVSLRNEDVTVWPPPIGDLVTFPEFAIPVTRWEFAAGVVGGFLLVYIGSWIVMTGPVVLLVTFALTIWRKPAFAWALLVGGAIGAACPGSCISNLFELSPHPPFIRFRNIEW